MSEPTTEDLLEQTVNALRQLQLSHCEVVKILQGVQQWCQLMNTRVRELEQGKRPWARQEHPERNQG